jgi:hypothetical protein
MNQNNVNVYILLLSLVIFQKKFLNNLLLKTYYDWKVEYANFQHQENPLWTMNLHNYYVSITYKNK